MAQKKKLFLQSGPIARFPAGYLTPHHPATTQDVDVDVDVDFKHVVCKNVCD